LEDLLLGKRETSSLPGGRSPIITHGAWVLPVVMVGMIEPSAMRSFFTP
jgi:hypothetical protein